MNAPQARFLLQVYRGGEADGCDPLFREALAVAAKDPRMFAWLENGRTFDAVVCSRIVHVAVPLELREEILAGGRATHFEAARRGRRIRAIGLGLFGTVALSFLLWAICRG
jgi:hypothetical protein